MATTITTQTAPPIEPTPVRSPAHTRQEWLGYAGDLDCRDGAQPLADALRRQCDATPDGVAWGILVRPDAEAHLRAVGAYPHREDGG